MFKQLILVGIWKFCVVGNLSDEVHSISLARFHCIICDKTLKCEYNRQQLNKIDNILLSTFSGIKAVFHSVNFCSWRFFCYIV